MISVTVDNFTANNLRATISGLKSQKKAKKQAKSAFRSGLKLFKISEIRAITSFFCSLKLVVLGVNRAMTSSLRAAACKNRELHFSDHLVEFLIFRLKIPLD